MFLANVLVLYCMPNNFQMTVKELCLYTWASASRAVWGQLRVPFVLFPKKRVHSAMGEPLSRCGRCRESKRFGTASTQSLYCSYHALFYIRWVTLQKFGQFRFEPYL